MKLCIYDTILNQICRQLTDRILPEEILDRMYHILRYNAMPNYLNNIHLRYIEKYVTGINEILYMAHPDVLKYREIVQIKNRKKFPNKGVGIIALWIYGYNHPEKSNIPPL